MEDMTNPVENVDSHAAIFSALFVFYLNTDVYQLPSTLDSLLAEKTTDKITRVGLESMTFASLTTSPPSLSSSWRQFKPYMYILSIIILECFMLNMHQGWRRYCLCFTHSLDVC